LYRNHEKKFENCLHRQILFVGKRILNLHLNGVVVSNADC
jgi:hypothetical protein